MRNQKSDCPHKPDVDQHVAKARAALQKFKDAHLNFELDLDLQIVDDNLVAIAQDNHKAQ
jgi:hypothetical protein